MSGLFTIKVVLFNTEETVDDKKANGDDRVTSDDDDTRAPANTNATAHQDNTEETVDDAEATDDTNATATSTEKVTEKKSLALTKLLSTLSKYGYSAFIREKNYSNYYNMGALLAKDPQFLIVKGDKLIDLEKVPSEILEMGSWSRCQLHLTSSEELFALSEWEAEVLKTTKIQQFVKEITDMKRYYFEEVGLIEEIIDAFSMLGLFMRCPYYESQISAFPPLSLEEEVDLDKSKRVSQFMEYLENLYKRYPAFRRVIENFIAIDHIVGGPRDSEGHIVKLDPNSNCQYFLNQRVYGSTGRRPAQPLRPMIQDHSKYLIPYRLSLKTNFQFVRMGGMCMQDEFGPMIRDCFRPYAFLVKVEEV